MAKVYYYGTGRRKHAVARVRLVPGTGNIIINGQTIDEYFGLNTEAIVRQQLQLTGAWVGSMSMPSARRWFLRSGRSDPPRHLARSAAGRRSDAPDPQAGRTADP